MSLTYAIADLHGRIDLLDLALDAIAKHRSPEKHTVVFLGDYVDRGPWSRQVIERLMAGPGDSGDRWICLTGNHEDIMLQVMNDANKFRWWSQNGGVATLVSYGAREGESVLSGLERIRFEHEEWLRGLPEEFDDGRRFFVHAGVDPFAQVQTRETKLWKLYEPGCPHGWRGRHVVHGHHFHEYGPMTWGDRTNLDVCAYHTGRLVVGIFDDDKPGGPIEHLEVIGDDLDRAWNVARSASVESSA